MGIRDVANAAVEAEKAAQEAEKLRLKNNNATAGVQIVRQMVGLDGKAVYAEQFTPTDARPVGQSTIVEIPDDDGPLYLRVNGQANYTRAWDGNRTFVGHEPYLEIVFRSDDGSFSTYYRYNGGTSHRDTFSSSTRIRSIADLGRALKSFDDWLARRKKSEGAK